MVWRPVQGVHHLHPTVAWIDSRNPVTPKTDSLGLKIDWCWSKAPKYVVLYNTFPHPTDDLTYRAVEKWRGVNPKPFILNNFHSKDLVETAPHLRWPSDMLTSYFKQVYMMKLAEKKTQLKTKHNFLSEQRNVHLLSDKEKGDESFAAPFISAPCHISQILFLWLCNERGN